MPPLDSTGPAVLRSTTLQTSRGKLTDFQYTTAGFTLPALDGYGFRHLTLTLPALAPHDPVPVRRLIPYDPRFLQTPPRDDALALL